MMPDEEYWYTSFRLLLVSVFNNCNLSNQYTVDLWVCIIKNFVDPICGGVDEFKDFLFYYVEEFYLELMMDVVNSALDEDDPARKHSPEGMYAANMALLTYALCNQLGDRNSHILSYAKEAINQADILYETSAITVVQQSYKYVALCLSVYQRICVLNYDNEAYTSQIPEFWALTEYIRELWVEVIKLFDSQGEKHPFQKEYDDFCFWISDEGIEYAADPYEFDMKELKDFEKNISDTEVYPEQKPNKYTDESITLSSNDKAAFDSARQIEIALNELFDTNILHRLDMWACMDFAGDIGTDKLLKIRQLDTFGGLYYPKKQGRTLLIAQLSRMEAAFSYSYSREGEHAKCKEHLERLLAYYKMYRYHEKVESKGFWYTGAAFMHTDVSLPGAATLLGKYGHVLSPELLLWFVEGLLRIMEEYNALCGIDNKRLHEGYMKAVDLARNIGDSEKEEFYKAKIADVTDVRFTIE